MKWERLVIIVEGDSEIILMNNLVIPYLYSIDGISPCAITTQKITTNRKLNKKGGNINFQYLKNEVDRVAAQGRLLITTFLDFFRLPNDFPGYTTDGTKISQLEAAMKETVGLEGFIPYIQKYEFETLLFSGMEGFELIVDDTDTLSKIREIIASHITPEDINGGTSTAPSKRLEQLFPYNKTADSELILEMLDVEIMREKCPRFDEWIQKVIDALKEN